MSSNKKGPSRPMGIILAAAAATLTLIPNTVVASPSVNVALSASFNSAPYLMELLETAAEENSTAYFPLLDRIADGTFVESVTEQDLYEQFLRVLSDDGHLTHPDALSSFKFALSIRSTAPRIQAHYQYYNTSVEPSLMVAQDAVCQAWAHYNGEQHCSPGLVHAQQPIISGRDHLLEKVLPFDRILGDGDGDDDLPSLVLYADLTSPLFNEFHKTLAKRARDGEFTYRVRYRPSTATSDLPPQPLFVSGYGVELALKRTDYTMIDDRDAEEKDDQKSIDTDSKPTLAAEDSKGSSTADLKPLSSSEVSRLGVNAASFVMNSDDPFETLSRLSQDFPRHSSNIANFNATKEFLLEYHDNRIQGLAAGHNTMWINGVKMESKHIDAFSLLAHLRHERKLMNSFGDIGLSAMEAVTLLSDPVISKAQAVNDVQRFDYRDDTEGGHVIIWLNDIEKDARYDGWAQHVTGLLQPMYPGQFHQIRRDIHNVVVPVNLADPEDVHVIQQIQSFIKRRIPIRFGLVPTPHGQVSIDQAKIAHYLHETYGLATFLTYFGKLQRTEDVTAPNKDVFETVVMDKEPRKEHSTSSFEDILQGTEFDNVITNSESYLKRLGADGPNPPVFGNGAAIPGGENWLKALVGRLSSDIEGIQRKIYEEVYDDDAWLPEFYLGQALLKRNPLIVPEDPSNIQVENVNELYSKHKAIFDALPRIPAVVGSQLETWAQLILVVDVDSEQGTTQLAQAAEFHKAHPEVEILILHRPSSPANPVGFSARLYDLTKNARDIDADTIISATESEASESKTKNAESAMSENYFDSAQPLVTELGLPGDGINALLNGRIIGPALHPSVLDAQDLELALSYERQTRIAPVSGALSSLELTDKIRDPLDLARLTSLVAHSTTSDVPEGIFDNGPMVRSNVFSSWNSTYSGISVSNTEDPTIQIVSAVDPTTETAQRWIQILKALSKMNGISLKLYLSPRIAIKEIPIKRFYRHVLEAAPSFDSDGSLKKPLASFHGVPEEALLNLGMDVPSSWLVAPKDSVHDLDNIKLNTLKEGANVDAIYELEHILIEGHSRDLNAKSPPRGVQLRLGTEKNPHFADTIIMANLGYFQFKAQPGYWQISLKPGQSEDIFHLESVGGMGYAPTPGDENNEVALLSFQGKTLFPRLSRKPGHESDDVLEAGPKPGSPMDYVSKGLNFASGVISGVVGPKAEQHADINIFSVASGHLYERMLNIMMVSVMRNTKHTVKFWFIEQFLSPSFKSFLPHLAKEYGFSYEMVTYKWPHWLRPQSEKQREIWGYKMLFLDVLFPLSLDKVIFVDADQIVRTDMYDLVTLDLENAPYGFTPMCDSRTSMEGFRFWKQGYWERFLRGLPYHISALYVVDLNRFRQIAAGDRLRGQYQALSADPGSLSNLDQDLPNHMQHMIPIKSLPQEWLWCETWCSDEDLSSAKTIDLCNNPLTKEPKLDRARRQVPEWTVYDEEIADLMKSVGEDEGEAAQEGNEEEEEGEKGEEGEEEVVVEEEVTNEPDVKDEL